MRRSFLHTLFTLALCAALPAVAQDATSDAPLLRVVNASGQPFAKLTLIFPRQRVEFSALAPGAESPYQRVPGGVYAYAAIEYQVPGQEPVSQLVMDWTRERPLPGSRFTYTLRYSDSPSSGRQLIAVVTTDQP